MKITSREKRFLIVGGLIAAAVMGVYLLPVVVPEDLADSVRQRQNRLRMQREMLGDEAIYKARIAQYQERLSKNRDRLLPGESQAAATAELNKLIKSLADASQVETGRFQNLAEEKLPENLTKVTISVDLTCSIEQLIRFLASLESADRFLRVEYLQIQGSRLAQDRSRINIPQCRFSGYIMTPAAAAKPAEKSAGGN